MRGIKDIGKVYDDFFGPGGNQNVKGEGQEPSSPPAGEEPGKGELSKGSGKDKDPDPSLELEGEVPASPFPKGTIDSLADEVRRIREMVEGDISAIDEAVRKTLESNGEKLGLGGKGQGEAGGLPGSGDEKTGESLPVPQGDGASAMEPAKETKAQSAPKEEKPEKPAMEELEELIGLTTIKKDVKELVDLVKTQTLREQQGLRTVPVSLHLVFSGNPGTGKTTVARILARLYKEIGALKQGQLVECDRSSLVAGFVGQTAIKTKEKIKEAMGGILFIDEAYTLAKEGQDYGQEAIDTLLKEMEDHRGEFVVIVAGYTKLMERFIDSNPGLRSRFTKYIEFPDYTCQELCAIFDLQLKKYQYVLDEEARRLVEERIAQMESAKGENFANARDVRTLFEKLITVHATRISRLENPSQEELKTIRGEDVAGLFQGEVPQGASQAKVEAPLELAEDSEGIEETEASEEAEVTEATEETKVTEEVEVAEETKVTEEAEVAEETKVTEETEES